MDANVMHKEARLPLWPWGFTAASVIAVAAVLIAPLAAYVFMIALFGLPHVLCELRYCDERFSARSPRAALFVVGTLLGLLVAARIAQAAGVLYVSLAVVLELCLGAGLAGTAVWFMKERRFIGALTGFAIAVGVALAPIQTFLVFAWAHNLTPLAFVAEIAPPSARRRMLLLLALPFALVPAIIASGLPQAAIQSALDYDAAGAPSFLGAGRYPVAAFLTTGMPFADVLPLFSAAVAAQAMHYFAVIAVLPRLLTRYGRGVESPPLLAWPSWHAFYMAVAALAIVVFGFHAINYAGARAAYGVTAALHSWVELPIFLIALGGGFRVTRRAPAP